MPPNPPRPAPANFTALRHYSHTPLPSAAAATTTTTSTPPAPLTTEIHSLRRLIMDQELTISTLRQQPPPAPKTKLHTLKALKKAHDTAFATIDHLPPADSPLNLLLAYRSVLLVAARTDTSLAAVKGAIAAAAATLEREGAELAQQRALAGALAGRVARLEEEEEGEGGVGGAGAGGVAEVVKRRREVGRRAAGVLRELRGFVGGVLAGMLLCEERGGGVVGDVVVGGGGEEGGEAGGGRGKRRGERRGERRIDEMWGQEGEEEEEPEKRVAREFMELLEALMNAALENDPYIPTHQDTAIVRFLVRAKVAAFHPKDARRLRLVDFGSSVEDV